MTVSSRLFGLTVGKLFAFYINSITHLIKMFFASATHPDNKLRMEYVINLTLSIIKFYLNLL